MKHINRGDRIRTCDLIVPNDAHYQAVLHPVLYPYIVKKEWHFVNIFYGKIDTINYTMLY